MDNNSFFNLFCLKPLCPVWLTAAECFEASHMTFTNIKGPNLWHIFGSTSALNTQKENTQGPRELHISVSKTHTLKSIKYNAEKWFSTHSFQLNPYNDDSKFLALDKTLLPFVVLDQSFTQNLSKFQPILGHKVAISGRFFFFSSVFWVENN